LKNVTSSESIKTLELTDVIVRQLHVAIHTSLEWAQYALAKGEARCEWWIGGM